MSPPGERHWCENVKHLLEENEDRKQEFVHHWGVGVWGVEVEELSHEMKQ